MKLSSNFSLEEMVNSSTARIRKIDNAPSEYHFRNLSRLCKLVLQPIRDKFGNAIIVTSGYRSGALNRVVGGSKSSQHLKGEAADIVCQDNLLLWNLICDMIQNGEITVGQLIDEKNLSWIHISLPDDKHFNQILHL